MTKTQQYLVATQDEIGQWIPEHVGPQEPTTLDEAHATIAARREMPEFATVTLAIVCADDRIHSGSDVVEVSEPAS